MSYILQIEYRERIVARKLMTTSTTHKACYAFLMPAARLQPVGRPAIHDPGPRPPGPACKNRSALSELDHVKR